LTGRVVVVTGATAGIGRAAAIELARRGASVVLVGRDRARGEAALAAAREAGGGDASLELADLSSMAEVRALAARLLAAHPAIHVLVNDAAVITRRRETTVDGFERQLAVNHLAPFLLTRLLLDRLKASAPARVVTVASAAHRRGRIDFEDLQSERGARYSPTGVYSNTKLMNVLFASELARRLEGASVVSTSMHPGVVATRLLADFTRVPKALAFLVNLVGLSPEAGARTVVWLAASPEAPGPGYFVRERERRPSAAARDAALAARLWAESERLVEVDRGVRGGR